MNDRLFRDEALEYLSTRHGPGELLQVSAPWLERVYLAFLALVLSGALAALLIGIAHG